MAKNPMLYCATDKEIFDALASSGQHFSEATLLDMARKRGIFYSPQSDRMQLCSEISLLGFGFHGVSQIQGEFEKSAKTEKKTFKTLDLVLTTADFKSLAAEYKAEAEEVGEAVTSQTVGTTGFAINVKYVEVDFSKTRLRQRQKREAAIDFETGDGQTIITYPFNDKVTQIVEGLIDRAKALKKASIQVDEVDLSWITSFELRTKFFQELIKRVPGFTLEDVTRVQVDYGTPLGAEQDLLADGDAPTADELEVAGAVKDIALNGTSLHVSSEYKRLREKGFFLTSIRWSGRRIAWPHEIIEFEAGFDEPAVGVGYRYGVRTRTVRLESGSYARNPTTIPSADKILLLNLLQQASFAVYRDVKIEFNASKSSADGEAL